MTARVLDRLDASTAWHEVPLDEDSHNLVVDQELKIYSPPFEADDSLLTFVLFGTTAGHPRSIVGNFDNRCLYWQKSSAKPRARIYRIPAVAGVAVQPRTSDVRDLRSPADNIKALRELTGLTWEQIARLFGVSRRSVHHWAAGGKLSSGNEELLAEVVDLVRAIGASSPASVRHELFRMRPEVGMSMYDELRARHSSTLNDINRTAGSAY